MKLRVVLPSVLLVMVVVAGLVMPEVTGRLFEKRLRETIESQNASNPVLALRIASYERTWLTSRATIRVGSKEGKDLLEIRAHLRHGPFGGASFVAGTGEAHLLETEALTQRYYFGDAAPASITFSSSLSGSMLAAIKSPPVDKAVIDLPRMRATLAAMSGQLSVGRDEAARLVLELPRFELSENGRSVAYEGIELTSSWNRADQQAKEPSEASLSVKSIRVVSDKTLFDSSNVRMSLHGIPNKESLDFRMVLGTGPGSVTADGNRNAWDSFQMSFTVSDIDREALLKFTDDTSSIEKLKANERRKAELQRAAFEQFTRSLLRRDPAFSLDSMNWQSPDGNMTGALKLAVNKARWLAHRDLASLPGCLTADGKATVSRTLMLAVLSALSRDDASAYLVSGGYENTRENVQRAASAMAEQTLIELSALEGVGADSQSMQFNVLGRDGVFTINGVPFEKIFGSSNEVKTQDVGEGADPITVRIGHAGPLTGGIAHLGRDNENGVRLAIEQANAKKIRIGGRTVRFELLTEDDQADPRLGPVIAQKFANARVAGVIGHLNSGVTVPASAVYNEAGIPVITGSATNPRVTEQGFRTVFRTIGRDDRQGAAIGTYLAVQFRPKRVAIVDDSTAYGEALANEVARSLGANGVHIVGRQKTGDRATDFKTLLTNLRSMNPDVVFFGGMDTTAGPMLKQARALGLKAAFAFGDGACTSEMGKLAGGAAEGFVCAQSGLPTQMASYAFQSAFKAKFGEALQYAPFTYDGTQLLIAAMQKANSVDPAKFLPALQSISFEGATGHIEFDAKGDRRDAEVTIFRFIGGAIEPEAVVRAARVQTIARTR